MERSIQPSYSSETSALVAPMIVRGRVIDTDLRSYDGRGGRNFHFLSPDPHQHCHELPLRHPRELADLYELGFEDILDYLEALGSTLDLENNSHLQKALQGSYATAPTTPPIIEYSYETLRDLFRREVLLETAEKTVGIEYLENWVPTRLADGRSARVRAFGSRVLHIVAGNTPVISAMTIIRNALSRSDAIIKLPSNDPFTALAIVQSMCDMAPDHPLTKHVSVAYWEGGDKQVEETLYQPQNIEKIIAWGGLASVKHVTRYIQPGLELISLDPKSSISIIGKQVFDSDENMRDVARKLAADFAGMNQCGCMNSRKAYVHSGTEEENLDQLKILARYTYDAMLQLPERMSTKPREFDVELKFNVEAVRLQDDWYHVVGGEDEEGAVVVSLLPEKVSFADTLSCRVLNLIPVDVLDDVYAECDAYTQTVGIYPEALKEEMRDTLPLYGAQRIVSLGYALAVNTGLPQDSIEPLRRACKWIVDEVSVPEVFPPEWPPV